MQHIIINNYSDCPEIVKIKANEDRRQKKVYKEKTLQLPYSVEQFLNICPKIQHIIWKTMFSQI